MASSPTDVNGFMRQRVEKVFLQVIEETDLKAMIAKHIDNEIGHLVRSTLNRSMVEHLTPELVCKALSDKLVREFPDSKPGR